MPQKPVSDIEQSLIDEIRQTGHHKNYELIEYVNDVNRQYAQVLMEVNIDGEMDTAYTYGNERIALERFTGWTGYYTHDPRGSVSGVTDSEGRLWKSYRYGPTGDITFGKPQYNNSYAYNAEDYNPNLEVQYLRARYYDVERGNFLTEDTYLGKLTDPLTLNRYNYVKSSAPNYVDPSGYDSRGYSNTASGREPGKRPGSIYDGYDESIRAEVRKEHKDRIAAGLSKAQKRLYDAITKALDGVNNSSAVYIKLGALTIMAEADSEVDDCAKEKMTEAIISTLAGMLSEMAYYGRTSVEWNGIVQALIEWGIENKEEEMVEKYFNAQYYYTGKALFDDWYAEVGRLTTLTSLITSIAGFLGGGGSFSVGTAASGSAALAASGTAVVAGASAVTVGIVVAGVGVNGIIMESRGEARGEANRDKSEGESATENPQDYLDEALERQGLEKTPKKLKEKWTEGEYNYEVRVHEGNGKYTDADSIYRVSRQKVPDPNPKVQGSGKEYLGNDGKWYHESELIEFNKNGTPNPSYNKHGAKVTHIPVD